MSRDNCVFNLFNDLDFSLQGWKTTVLKLADKASGFKAKLEARGRRPNVSSDFDWGWTVFVPVGSRIYSASNPEMTQETNARERTSKKKKNSRLEVADGWKVSHKSQGWMCYGCKSTEYVSDSTVALLQKWADIGKYDCDASLGCRLLFFFYSAFYYLPRRHT